MSHHRTTSPDALNRPARSAMLFVGGTILLGVGIVGYSAWDLFTHGITPMWLALLILTLVTGWATLRIPAIPISFSISDTFSIIAALILGPSAGALTAAFDGLVLSCRMMTTRRSLHRVLFNMAAPAIATWAAAHVFFALVGPAVDGSVGARRLLGLVLFGVLNFALNTGIVATALSFERREPIWPAWRKYLLGLWVTYFAGVY